MPELIAQLHTLRAELVERMGSKLAADRDWQTWMSLLAQVETVIQAVEAVVKEGSRK